MMQIFQRVPNSGQIGGARLRNSRHRGVSAVETAIVLPLVMLFALASVDFGRVVSAYLALANANRCGAEYGVMHSFTAYTRPSWEVKVKAAIEEELETLSGVQIDNLICTLDTT